MATRLKSIRYSTFTKVAAIILAWLCLISIFATGIDLSNNEILYYDSYINLSEFKSEYSLLIYYTVELYTSLKSEEYIKTSGAFADETQLALSRYYYIKDLLSQYFNFAYYIKDLSTGEVVATNVNSEDPVGLIKKQKSMLHYIQGQGIDGWWFAENLGEMLNGTSYEVYTAVIEPLKKGDSFYDCYLSFNRLKTQVNLEIAFLIASTVILLLTLVYLIYAAGKKKSKEGIALAWWDRCFDLQTLIVLIAALKTLLYLDNYHYGLSFELLLILNIDFFIGLSYILSITRQIKAETLINNLLVLKISNKIRYIINKFCSFIKLCFNGKIFKTRILILLPVYFIINSVLGGAILLYFDRWLSYIEYGYYDSSAGVVFFMVAVLFLAINSFVFYMTAKSLKDLPEIMEAAKQMSAGNLDYKLDTKNMSITFSAFAENIQSIQMGLKKAVEDAIKGERMKTDLITNVSHDLKTPLTSIINYVGLLKKEPIENQKAQEYINILDEKSARLKVLIEDLIEASKASSGNLPVNIEKLDLCELVMQAVGEYRDKFEIRGLDVRTITDEKNIYVQADGKHMWRIVENLLSNVLKYSMKNSRVYINITRNEDYGILTIKNISELPLEIPVEQLTERFVRGDMSRTTEGSGLGLAIAKSLTDIQKGHFRIETDGDLFKATVEIPLWK